MSTKKVYFGPIPKKHIEMSNIENNFDICKKVMPYCPIYMI